MGGGGSKCIGNMMVLYYILFYTYASLYVSCLYIFYLYLTIPIVDRRP